MLFENIHRQVRGANHLRARLYHFRVSRKLNIKFLYRLGNSNLKCFKGKWQVFIFQTKVRKQIPVVFISLPIFFFFYTHLSIKPECDSISKKFVRLFKFHRRANENWWRENNIREAIEMKERRESEKEREREMAIDRIN